MNVNDKKILEALVRKYGNDGVNNAISRLNESFQEDTKYVNVLFSDLPENDDQYREYYEEDIEEGNVDPNEMDYETYVGELNARFINDLEDAIDRFDSNNNAPGYVALDNKYGKYAIEVYDNLWDAIKELASGEYFMLKQVGGHLELEVTNYNAQHRSRYSIYMLNSDGIEAFEEGEGDNLNDPKYWQPMKPIM